MGSTLTWCKARKVVAVALKPAFRKLFEIVGTKAESGAAILNSKQNPLQKWKRVITGGFGGDGGGLGSTVPQYLEATETP